MEESVTLWESRVEVLHFRGWKTEVLHFGGVCMSYTLSFDASQKVTREKVKGLLHHVCRDVDKANGVETRHSNKDIDGARTADNITFVPDGNGDLKLADSVDEVSGIIDAMLDGVKKPLRKDAVVLRPLVMQLDPEWYKVHTGAEERMGVVACLNRWIFDTFGKSRIAYIDVHNDETNPHIHYGFVPVTDDGRLAQKDWFTGPSALREMHQDAREYMASRGYDIEMGRKKPGKYAKRMSVDEYKDYAELRKQAEQQEQQRKALDQQRQEQDAARIRLQEQRAELDEREAALDEREKALDEWAAKLTEAGKQAPEKPQKAARSPVDRLNSVVRDKDAWDVKTDAEATREGYKALKQGETSRDDYNKRQDGEVVSADDMEAVLKEFGE